jgi:hypothetical protein
MSEQEPIVIRPGDVVIKGPNEALVYAFDWDEENLPDGVELAAAGTFTITVVAGLNTTPLTKDQESLLSGNRSSRVRLSGGTLGTLYNIAHLITTDETPTQSKEQSFNVKIQKK